MKKIFLFLVTLFNLLSPSILMAQHERTDLQVHFINAGYGDSILVALPGGNTLLIDAGSRNEAGKVAGYLKKLGVPKIDIAVITHPHGNHFGGFFRLIKEFPIGQAFINGHRSEEDGYPDLLQMLSDRHIPVSILARGHRIPDLPEGVSLEVLYPTGEDLGGDRNQNSIALKLTYGAVSILFTGDINEESQKDLVKIFGSKLHADCIQVPHHGLPISRTFVDHFKAPLYIISTGPSQWDLPLAEELERLPGKVLRTDREGDIVLRTDGRQLKVVLQGDRDES